MTIKAFVSRYMQSRAYLIHDGGRGIVIDPCDQEALYEAVRSEGIEIDYIFLTHEHCDHIVGMSRARETFHAPVICTEACGKNLADSRMNYSRYFDAFAAVQEQFESDPTATVEPFEETADETFCGSRTIQWQGHKLELISTPGHSPGSMCILIDGEVMFCGDTLFKEEYTQTGFMGGSRKEFLAITEPWLRGLDGSVVVYPGHLDSFILKERLKRKILV